MKRGVEIELTVLSVIPSFLMSYDYVIYIKTF